MNTNTPTPGEKVRLELPKAQALVLFEFLSRFSDYHKLESQDQAEEHVLWDICCDLEKAPGEHFRPDYADLLQRARDTVRDKED